MRPLWLTAPLAALFALPLAAAEPAKLVGPEHAVYNAAPAVIQALRDAGHARVGVLKFEAPKDGQAGTHNPGPLLDRLSRDLEIALLFRIKPKDQKHLGFLRDCVATASKLRGADQRTLAGRKALFTGQYPIAFGEAGDRVAADAFLVGEVRLKEGRELDIRLFVFDKTGERKPIGPTITALADTDALIDLGTSFNLRKAPVPVLPDAKDSLAAQTLAAGRVAKAKAMLLQSTDQQAPLEGLPLELTILYDGKPQKLLYDDSRNASVAEPTEEHVVTFRVRRRDPNDKALLGCVLRVNGINTVGKQKNPVTECRRWLLTPEMTELTVDGFFMPDEGMTNLFRVASAEESMKLEAESFYGVDNGTFDFVVFRSGSTAPSVPTIEPDPSEDRETRSLIVKGMRRGGAQVGKPFASRELARQEWLGEDRQGLVREDGPVVPGTAKVLEFANPELIGAVRITYRRPPRDS